MIFFGFACGKAPWWGALQAQSKYQSAPVIFCFLSSYKSWAFDAAAKQKMPPLQAALRLVLWRISESNR